MGKALHVRESELHAQPHKILSAYMADLFNESIQYFVLKCSVLFVTIQQVGFPAGAHWKKGILHHRSRIWWLEEGDANTALFHAHAIHDFYFNLLGTNLNWRLSHMTWVQIMLSISCHGHFYWRPTSLRVMFSQSN
ncbi:hypothetical protein ACJX0J_021872, partial [Zea mays]